MNAPSETVRVELGDRSYSIDIGLSLWDHLAQEIQSLFKPTRLIVVSDETVGRLYEPKLREAFASFDWKVSYHRMLPGEQNKNLDTVRDLYTEILDAGCDRKTPLIALGGGVPGDVGGFVAATILRGIPYVQVPTTLLAMVDSSVGGKTGVDMPHGKNLIGAFYQPSHVAISLDTLSTLPKRELSAGMAEVIKYGVIWDADFFAKLEAEMETLLKAEPNSLLPIVRRCCEIKAEVVSKDERESGLRAILNFGHTVGHAIEAAGAYGEFLHGEAIAIGMVVETAIAERLGKNLGDLRARLASLFDRAGLPTKPKQTDLDRIWTLMLADKKTLGGEIRLILPTCLGAVELVEGVDRELFAKAWEIALTQN
jgi:3-dehydroquinate synthase